MNLTNAAVTSVEILLMLRQGDGPVPSKDLVADLGRPVYVVQKVAQRLGSAGYVRSVRGHKGGFLLDCDLNEVTAFEICRLFTVSSSRAGSDEIGHKLNAIMQGALQRVTIAELARSLDT